MIIHRGVYSGYMAIYFVVFALLVFMGCASELNDAQKIIDRSINFHGGKKFSNSTIEFDFRGRHYVARRNGGIFSYERIFKDSDKTVHDYLTNDGFHREVDGVKVDVVDSMAAKYTRSVNSTIYFACLPFGLNDPAVIKKFLGETSINGEPYYKIEVTFYQEGGGEDHNDVFHYWIHKEKFSMDYFAYLYFTEGGGIRFRKAIRQHKVDGIVLQDYENYKPKADINSLDGLDQLYTAGELEALPKIELENIMVK